MDARSTMKVGVDRSRFRDEVGGTVVLQMSSILMEEFSRH